MPRGSRPGERRGGKKKGTPNRRTREMVEMARASGELPHEFLLRVARGEPILMGDKKTLHIPSIDERIDAAKAASEFFAPRLARTEQLINADLTHRSDDGKVASKLLPELTAGGAPEAARKPH